MTIPVVGHVIVLGYLGTMAISAIENAAMVGGLSAFGAAIYSMGVPKNSVIDYETAIKADGFLVMAHGIQPKMARAKTILGTMNPSRCDVHSNAKVADPARHPAAAEG